ncbi:MAG: hypothetical protein IJY58_02625 [Alphaproteobacteria bacterium]|nr:hypothetical protein [Alphaproteobacteria bacterium]
MKKNQIVMGLLCFSGVVSCQSSINFTDVRESQEADLVVLRERDCILMNNKFVNPYAKDGRTLSYELELDIDNDRKADISVPVMVDVTHMTQKQVQEYMNYVRQLPQTETKTIKEWKDKIQDYPLLEAHHIESSVMYVYCDRSRTK